MGNQANSMGSSRNRAWLIWELAILAGAGTAMILRSPSTGFIVSSVLILIIGWSIIHAIASHTGTPRRQRMVSLVLVGLLAVGGVANAFYRTHPTTLFRECVVDPIPPSIQILHCEYQGGIDPGVYLHFTLDSKDFSVLLEARNYTEGDETNLPIFIGPDWWPTKGLEGFMLYCWEDLHPDTDSPRNAAWLWVNEAKTEGYFIYWNHYCPNVCLSD